MNNIELAKKVADNLKGSVKKAEKFEDLVAVSFTLISEEDENIYVTVKDGKLDIAPYRYDDNNCEMEASAETIDALFSGALNFDKAINEGSVQCKRGELAKFKALECLVPEKKAAAKPADKKTAPAADKKTEPVKTESAKTETTNSAAAAPVSKPAAKPAAPNNNTNNSNKKKKK